MNYLALLRRAERMEAEALALKTAQREHVRWQVKNGLLEYEFTDAEIEKIWAEVRHERKLPREDREAAPHMGDPSLDIGISENPHSELDQQNETHGVIEAQGTGEMFNADEIVQGILSGKRRQAIRYKSR